METKAADVFAFGMLAIEVFTGKIPFEEQKNEAVVLRISRGGRPGMPENAQEVGLTPEVWNLLENCWHQNPKKRPMIQDVVRRLQRWIGNGDVSPEYVQTALAAWTPSQLSAIDLGYRRLQRNLWRALLDAGSRQRQSQIKLD